MYVLCVRACMCVCVCERHTFHALHQEQYDCTDKSTPVLSHTFVICVCVCVCLRVCGVPATSFCRSHPVVTNTSFVLEDILRC